MTIEQLYAIFQQHPAIQTDTRKLRAGEIYLALKGENFNGNQFASQALKNGAAFAIIDEAEYACDERCILVHDSLETLQLLARHHRLQLNIPIIAITGSNGKTTTKELLTAVLSSQYKTIATKGNLNNHIGVPLTLLSIPPDTEMAIIEMGANHQKEIATYCQWALPSHAIINNCGKAHLEGFGGIEGVRKGKGELYDFIRESKGIIFRNADYDYLATMAKGIEHQITYGTQQADYTGITLHNNATVQVAITTPRLECTIRSQLVGDYNTANIMAAVAVGDYFDIPIQKIKSSIEAYSPSNSRSQLIHAGTNTFIMDAYNANPSSMQVAIQNFIQYDSPNKIVILGGMKELGEESIAEHQAIVDLLMTSNWNHVVLVGGDFEHTQHPYLYFSDVLAAKQWLHDTNPQQCAILIKGSRAMTMEKIIDLS